MFKSEQSQRGTGKPSQLCLILAVIWFSKDFESCFIYLWAGPFSMQNHLSDYPANRLRHSSNYSQQFKYSLMIIKGHFHISDILLSFCFLVHLRHSILLLIQPWLLWFPEPPNANQRERMWKMLFRHKVGLVLKGQMCNLLTLTDVGPYLQLPQMKWGKRESWFGVEGCE